MSLGPSAATTGSGRAVVVRVLKLVLGLLVIAAVARHVTTTWLDLRTRGESVEINPGWLVLSILLYLTGLTLDGVWFHRVMQASFTPIPLLASIRAYLVSHLGKYVPGKAMVVVMRASIASSAGARPASAVFASMYETLVMMASGALIAAMGYALAPARSVPLNLGPLGTQNISLMALGGTLGAAFLFLASPPVFPRLAAFASASLRGVGAGAVPRLSARLLVEGLAWSGLGWLFLGASQYAVLRALGIEGLGLAQMPVLVASVALATVAGFVVAVAPGGLGVREWVLWTSLGVLIDHDQAVIAALVLRFAWVLGEVLAAVISSLGSALRRASITDHPSPASTGPIPTTPQLSDDPASG